MVTCCALLMLSWIGGDLLQIRLVLQGQAWRVLWLATVIAILLLASHRLAMLAGSDRCAAAASLLLATAWIIGDKIPRRPSSLFG